MTRVSVIVPARNASTTVRRTLAALAGQDIGEGYEVIVVDDGSDDETAAMAERAPGPVSVLRQSPEGPAAARNRGAAAARGESLAFLDADCFPQPGWLSAGVMALVDADLVQGRVTPEHGKAIGPFDRSLWIERETALYETANLFVGRDLFERIGGFEEWLEPAVGKAIAEDVWFGWRARRAGARTTFCREAVVEHAVISRGPRSFVADRRRLRHFPDLVAKIPELRRELLYARIFLAHRTAAFDAAIAGCVAAVAMRSSLPLVAALPYGRYLRNMWRSWKGHYPPVVPVIVVADAVACAALVRGSAARLTPVL